MGKVGTEQPSGNVVDTLPGKGSGGPWHVGVANTSTCTPVGKQAALNDSCGPPWLGTAWQPATSANADISGAASHVAVPRKPSTRANQAPDQSSEHDICTGPMQAVGTGSGHAPIGVLHPPSCAPNRRAMGVGFADSTHPTLMW